MLSFAWIGPLLIGVWAALSGCSSSTAGAPLDAGAFDAGASCSPVPSYADLLTATFEPRCSGRCHGSGGMTPAAASGPINLSGSSTRAELVDRSSIYGMGLVLVVPGHPESSFLIRKLTNNLPSDASLGSPMPLGEAIAWQMIPQSELDRIDCWIAGGAP